MVEAGVRRRPRRRAWRDRRRRARLRPSIARSLAPSPTASVSSAVRGRSSARSSRKVASLASRPRIGSATRPASRPLSTTAGWRDVRQTPSRSAIAPVNSVKPPDTIAVIGAVGAHGLHQRARARRHRDRALQDFGDDRLRAPASSATRSRKAGSKAISPRIARSVIAATRCADADARGEFVDAFLTDQGRIHIGDQQLLAPALAPAARSRRSPRPPARDQRAPRACERGLVAFEKEVGGDAAAQAIASSREARQTLARRARSRHR